MTDYQDMKLKVSQGILLTQNQVQEIGNAIMNAPDAGWGHASDGKEELPYVYELEHHGDYGKYHIRVNRSWGMITLLALK